MLALGSSAIVKVLGQNDAFVFLGSLQQMAFAPERFFGVFPKQFFTLVSQSPVVFGQMAVASERFCGGFRQLFVTFVSQMAVAS